MKCYQCDGNGWERDNKQTSEGYTFGKKTCSKCNGTGIDIIFNIQEKYCVGERVAKLIHSHSQGLEKQVEELEEANRGANKLAYECARQIQLGRIDSRSGIGDAVLNYLKVGGGSHCPNSVPQWMEQYEQALAEKEFTPPTLEKMAELEDEATCPHGFLVGCPTCIEALAEGKECKCTMTQSVLGDGCDICNPEKAEEIERENQETCKTKEITCIAQTRVRIRR